MSTTCDRCYKETRMTAMSFFNTDVCCIDCIKLERTHPAYEEAKRLEGEQVLAGNYSFGGVGLPAGYHAWAKEQTDGAS